jgi:hypothetical protein
MFEDDPHSGTNHILVSADEEETKRVFALKIMDGSVPTMFLEYLSKDDILGFLNMPMKATQNNRLKKASEVYVEKQQIDKMGTL